MKRPGASAFRGSTVKLGSGVRIDKGAIIGYPSGRAVADPVLAIGAGSLIRAGAVLYEGSRIGRNLETGHGTILREENVIGDDCRVWSNSIVDYGCRIGHGVSIHCNVYIAQYSVIEDGVFVGPGTVFLNDPHPGCSYSRQCMRGPVIRKGAQIGGGCVILPMVTVGEGALVGGGSVISRDVPAGSVAFGKPARPHGRRSALKCWTGHTSRPYRTRAAK